MRRLVGGAVWYVCAITGVAQAQQPSPGAAAPSPVDTSAVGVTASVEFLESAEDWRTIAVDRVVALQRVTIIPRLTGAQRFGNTGAQLEVEAYPRFSRGYLYLAAAASPHRDVFVPFRGALEAYGYPGNGWELSGGGRYLHVTDDDIFAATATVARYFGSYWLSLRPTVTWADPGRSRAIGAALRRYGAGRHDFHGVHAVFSRGANPEALDPARAGRAPALRAWSALYERKMPVRSDRARATFRLGLEREEVSPDRHRIRVLTAAGIEFLRR